MEHEIISRAEAKAKGLKFYFTGKPCRKGGIGKRRVANKQCVCDICRIKDMQRTEIWRVENREKYLCGSRSHYEINKENRKETAKLWREANRDNLLASRKEYYNKNKDKILKNNKHWLDENPSKKAEIGKKYRQNNPDKICAETRKRQAAKIAAVPSWFGELDELLMQEAYALKAERYVATGIEWHVDHMVPLRARKACGLHCAGNIQVILAAMNLSKGNKMLLTEPLAWLR